MYIQGMKDISEAKPKDGHALHEHTTELRYVATDERNLRLTRKSERKEKTRNGMRLRFISYAETHKRNYRQVESTF